MKRIISVVLAVGMVLSFAACGRNDEAEMPTEIETSTEAVLEEETSIDEIIEDAVVEEAVNDENAALDAPEQEKEEVIENTDKTLGNTILTFFKENANEGKSIEEIAEGISQMEEIAFNCMSMPVEPGFLAGFDEEITGFTTAVTFAPMIGSIPFVGYIFETDDADNLITSLKANANLRWNICVEAEEMVTGKAGNKVFFVMCPKSLDEAE